MREKLLRHILVIDIGGGHVKYRVSNKRIVEQFSSGTDLTAREMTRRLLERTRGWRYHNVTIGFPGMVINGRIVCEPVNLGLGWIGFNFTEAFGRPTRIVNDAVMQALGSYVGSGRMLFLGFGTGLGAVLIADSKIYPMELALWGIGGGGGGGLGFARWSENAKDVIQQVRRALEVRFVVVGGGNAMRLKRLPRYVIRADNTRAFAGGIRVWRENWTH